MFVFNTTYYVKDEQIGGFLHWLRHEYLQKAVETGFLKNPQIYRVMNEATDNQTSYAVQFDIDTLNGLREWKRHHEATLNARVANSSVNSMSLNSVSCIAPTPGSYQISGINT